MKNTIKTILSTVSTPVKLSKLLMKKNRLII